MYSLKTLILWTFKISSQIKHELTTLLTIPQKQDTRQESIDRTCSCSFAEENRQSVGCTSMKNLSYVSYHLYISCTPVA